MKAERKGKVALLWRGDLETRRQCTASNSRWHAVFAALASHQIDAEPCVYCEEAAAEVHNQLCKVAGVLVWVDPLSNGRTRFALDAILRDLASNGVWISANPDVTQKMGVKDVLYTTKHLGWGTDTNLYRSFDEFRAKFPHRLETGPLVVKRNRGNGGQGIWKVERASRPGNTVIVLEARRGSEPQTMLLAEFIINCGPYFINNGHIIEQPFQERLSEGMIRCYMGADKVVGFGHQLIKALVTPPPQGANSTAAQPGPRIMHPATAPAFQALRQKMERDWVPQMMRHLGIIRSQLPIIWDADFLYGPRTPSGEDTFVLCEINVSLVMPIPDDAPTAIAALTYERLTAAPLM